MGTPSQDSASDQQNQAASRNELSAPQQDGSKVGLAGAGIVLGALVFFLVRCVSRHVRQSATGLIWHPALQVLSPQHAELAIRQQAFHDACCRFSGGGPSFSLLEQDAVGFDAALQNGRPTIAEFYASW